MNIKTVWVAALVAALWISTPHPASAENDNHDNDSDHVDDERNVVEISAADRAANDISVSTAEYRGLSDRIIMPAEVVINAYASASVTTRIGAQVIERHVKLGDSIEKNQALVTLSSVEMAEAQSALVVANLDWQRMRVLGKATVSERRYIEADISRRQAFAKVLAYGMSEAQANELMKSDTAVLATGEFVLLSPQQGTVLSDDFVMGELIEPGRVLFLISDESTLWVEASTMPSDTTEFAVGAPARIAHGEDHWINGQIIQLHHQLDETTRRQGLRIEVDNTEDHLHPGQFVEAEISTGVGPSLNVVPNAAITLLEGKTTVFVLEDDHEFRPQVVETGMSAGGWTEIRSGIGGKDKIAVSGVFFIKSLMLKSSLGEGHAH